MYAGCVAGAIAKKEYLSLIEHNGFGSISIQKEKRITIPDDILSNYFNQAALADFKAGSTGIFSIAVYAEKLAMTTAACCGPACCN